MFGQARVPLPTDRHVPSVPYPETQILGDFDIYNEKMPGKPDHELLRTHLIKVCTLIPTRFILETMNQLANNLR